MSRLLTANEVALAVGISVHTLDLWYKFKRQNPEHEFSKLLPEYTQETEKSNRLWDQNDMWKLVDFKQRIPKGRRGVMGSVTQKYVKKKEDKTNGAKTNSKRRTAGKRKKRPANTGGND